ncbi:hypothetical protein DVK02_00910 [Halobellus sp. Atlit-31R]|nr:hypothetical protein DVK02_00910 [Halobellus sp. Atlit-31R]
MTSDKPTETADPTVAEPTDESDSTASSASSTPEQSDTGPKYPKLSRRGLLLTGGLFGLLGLGSSSASAAASGSGQIGTSTTPLKTLYANALAGGVTGGNTLNSLDGAGLQLSGNSLDVDAASPLDASTAGLSLGLGQGVEDSSGSLTTSLGNGLQFDANDAIEALATSPLSVDGSGLSLGLGQGVEDSSGSLTTSLGNGLQFDANDAIEPNLGNGFEVVNNEILPDLGTGLEFDSNTGEIKTADTGSASVSKLTTATSSIDALEVTETGAISAGTAQDVNVVGGSPDHDSNGNDVSNVTVFGKTHSVQADTATISGGESNSVQPASSGVGGGTVGGGKSNSANSDFVTVAGGNNNSASLDNSTIGGGTGNSILGASGDSSAIAGGKNNSIQAGPNAIGGGEDNAISDGFTHGAIAGGQNNTATAAHASIIGGKDNTVDDTFGIAGGDGNTASGGIALGKSNQAKAIAGSSPLSVAIGDNNTATGNAGGAILIGSSNTGPSAIAPNVVAIGRNNEVKQPNAVAIGNNCVVGGSNSFALGTKAEAGIGDDSSALTNAFVWSDGKDATGADLGSDATNKGLFDGEARFFTSGGFYIENTKEVQVTQGLPPNGSASSVGIDGSGNLVNIGTSSARYKTNIEPLGTDTSGVLELQPTAYEYEETGQADTGLIAEEVDEALPEIVNYDDEGRPDAVRYDRVGMFLAPEVSENRDRLADLEATKDDCQDELAAVDLELEARDARIDDQRDRIDHLEHQVSRRDETIASYEAELEQVRAENEELSQRLESIEAELGLGWSQPSAEPADD